MILKISLSILSFNRTLSPRKKYGGKMENISFSEAKQKFDILYKNENTLISF